MSRLTRRVFLIYLTLLLQLWAFECCFAQQNPNLSLIDTVRYGDVAGVEQLLKDGADVNYQDAKHFSPIIYAVSAGRMEIVDKLIQHGAILDGKNGQLTALMVAARRGEVPLVKKLIAAGANVNAAAASEHGASYTPLIAACLSDNPNPEVVKILVEAGGTRDKLALLNAFSLSRRRGLTEIESILAKSLGNIERVVQRFQYNTVRNVWLGLIVALLGLLIWPFFWAAHFAPRSVSRPLKRIFWMELFLQLSFLGGMTVHRLLAGWSPSYSLVATLFLSYYFATVGVLGIIASLVVLMVAPSDPFRRGKAQPVT